MLKQELTTTSTMSDQNGYRGGPPPEESAYPPPPGEEEEDRQRHTQYPPPPSAHVTLPPIQDAHPAYGRYAPSAPPDPRTQGHYAASPPGANGHPPPPAGYQLPPVQPPPDQRYGVEPRYDYAAQGRGSSYPPPPPPPEHYNYTYRPSSGSPYGSGPYEYRGAPPAPAQAAPRQRTSIACSYCRRRKVSCVECGGQRNPDDLISNLDNHRSDAAVTARPTESVRTAERLATSASSSQSAILRRLHLYPYPPSLAALLLARLCTAHLDNLSHKVLEVLLHQGDKWRHRRLAHSLTHRTRDNLRVSRRIRLDRPTTLLLPRTPTAADASTTKSTLLACRLLMCTAIQILDDARPHPPCKVRPRLKRSTTTHRTLRVTSRTTELARLAVTALHRPSKGMGLVP